MVTRYASHAHEVSVSDRGAWDDAACQGESYQLDHDAVIDVLYGGTPSRVGDAALTGQRIAAACASPCPLRDRCYADAIGKHYATGIYGGVVFVGGKPVRGVA